MVCSSVSYKVNGGTCMQGYDSKSGDYVPMFERVFGAFKKPVVYAAVVLSGLIGNTSAYSDSRLNPCKNQDLSRYMRTRNDCLDIVYSSTPGSAEYKVAGVERFVRVIANRDSINETVARGSDIVFQVKTPEEVYSLSLQNAAGLSLERQIELLNARCASRHQPAQGSSQSYAGSDHSGLQRAYQEERNLDGVDADLEGGSESTGMLVGFGIGRFAHGRLSHGHRGRNGGERHTEQPDQPQPPKQPDPFFKRGGTGTTPPDTHPINSNPIR